MSVKDSESRRFEPRIGLSFSQAEVRPTPARDLLFFGLFPKFGTPPPHNRKRVVRNVWRVSLKSKLLIDTSLSHFGIGLRSDFFLKTNICLIMKWYVPPSTLFRAAVPLWGQLGANYLEFE